MASKLDTYTERAIKDSYSKDEETGKFACKICGKLIKHEASIEYHMKSFHAEKIENKALLMEAEAKADAKRFAIERATNWVNETIEEAQKDLDKSKAKAAESLEDWAHWYQEGHFNLIGAMEVLIGLRNMLAHSYPDGLQDRAGWVEWRKLVLNWQEEFMRQLVDRMPTPNSTSQTSNNIDHWKHKGACMFMTRFGSSGIRTYIRYLDMVCEE